MRPILFKVPALPLLIACLLVAVIAVLRDVVPWKGKKPVFPMTSVWALGGAGAVLRLIGKAGIEGADVLANLRVGFVPIYAYGVMLGTSLVVGWFIAMHLAKQDGIDQQEAGTIYMWSAVWSIIGSRLLWYFTTPTAKISDIPLVNQGGLVAYGGMIGGFIATVYLCRRRGIPLLQWADVAAPSVVLGTGITRIGCFLFGCDYGKRTDLPWAVQFPKGSPAWHHHVSQMVDQLPETAARSFPVHPTQIYESLVGLSLFGLLMLIRRYRPFSGLVFIGWVVGYGVLRSLIEQLRADEDRGLYFNDLLSTSQIIGIVSSLLGLGLFFVLLRKYRRDPAGSRLWEQVPTMTPARVEQGGGKRRKRR